MHNISNLHIRAIVGTKLYEYLLIMKDTFARICDLSREEAATEVASQRKAQ